MHVARSVTYIAAAALGLCMFAPPKARADEWNQKTVVTFSGPVEIPGRVLPAGTYTFKLLDSQSDRNIIEVLDKNEQHSYGTFLAIPDYRLNPSGKVIITFRERAAGAPEALRAWFYPGDNYGHEFVYPRVQAQKIAQATGQNVPSTGAENYATAQNAPSQSDMSSMKQSDVKSMQPSQQESELGADYTNQQAQSQSQTTQSQNDQMQNQAQGQQTQNDQTMTQQSQNSQTQNSQAQNEQQQQTTPPSTMQTQPSMNNQSTQEANREAQDTQPATPPQQYAQNSPSTQNTQNTTPSQLPQTGSDLPFVAVIGLLSLGAAGSLRLAAAKISK